MSVVEQFVDKKKANSEYVLLDDGESCVMVTLREMKIVTKTGFNGEEKEVLRLVGDFSTSEGIKSKKFDNGTQRFAESLIKSGVTVGCGFTITRHGLGPKTRYDISEVQAMV